MVLFQKTDKSLNSSFKTFLSTSEQTYTTCELCLPETQSSVNSLTAFSLWPLLAAEHSPWTATNAVKQKKKKSEHTPQSV